MAKECVHGVYPLNDDAHDVHDDFGAHDDDDALVRYGSRGHDCDSVVLENDDDDVFGHQSHSHSVRRCHPPMYHDDHVVAVLVTLSDHDVHR